MTTHITDDTTSVTPTSITVYSKPQCVQCDRTKKYFDDRGITYEVVDLSTDEVALARMKSLNLLQAPVVEVNGDVWTGFRTDKLRETANRLGKTELIAA